VEIVQWVFTDPFSQARLKTKFRTIITTANQCFSKCKMRKGQNSWIPNNWANQVRILSGPLSKEIPSNNSLTTSKTNGFHQTCRLGRQTLFGVLHIFAPDGMLSNAFNTWLREFTHKNQPYFYPSWTSSQLRVSLQSMSLFSGMPLTAFISCLIVEESICLILTNQITMCLPKQISLRGLKCCQYLKNSKQEML